MKTAHSQAIQGFS